MDRTVYLVAPDSVLSWLPYFRSADDRGPVEPIGSDPMVDVDRLAAICHGRTAVFVSAHETLLRDRALADHLADRGHRVQCQSHRATLLGLDKLVTKEFLRAEGIPTLPWSDPRGLPVPCPAGGPASGHPVVVKARHGTQSQGIRMLHRGGPRPDGGEFCEQYADGVEYSVVVYRDDDRLVVFPPVWKGSTGLDLLPPWRRLRRCPAPQAGPALTERLYELAVQIAVRAEVTGYLEIELLAPDDGDPVVLELNPRVSGTMRLVAMATGVPIFSPHMLPTGVTRPSAVRLAAEVPYDGPPHCDAAAAVFATSRLTVAADDPAELVGKLRRHRADPRWLDPAGFPAPPARTAAMATR